MLKTIRQKILDSLPVRFRFALRYMVVHRRFSLLLCPRMFTEKIMLRIAKDRRRLLKICADKLAMRRYIEQKVGAGCLPTVFCVTENPETINWTELPERFVVKGSHGSGFVSVVTGFNPADSAQIEKLVQKCREWLAVDYGKWSREWAYVDGPRNIFIEEFIESNYHDQDGVPWDFKFHVFDGRLAMIELITGRFSDRRENLYSAEWERLNATYGIPHIEAQVDKPANFEEMIALVEKAGMGIDYVRVDIFAAKKGLLIGEMTMTPAGGMSRISNPKLDRYLGAQWKMAPFRD